MKWTMVWLLVLGAFSLGLLAGRTTFAPEDGGPSPWGELREGSGRLTNPLLECEYFGADGPQVLRPFKYKVKQLIAEKIEEGVLTTGSVYFRDLNNGAWFGVNEREAYHPASMLKVPIMIAHLRVAQQNSAHLGTEILYAGDFDMADWQGIEPLERLVPGVHYTVEDLLHRMIAFSDNNAAKLLVDSIDKGEFDQVLDDLDVNTNPDDYEHFITIAGYSGFFRVLYNASYLNRELSEKALEILAESKFHAGIRAGLSPGQVAATKFGEWSSGPDQDIVQLHEFGIVYHHGRPYLLGIMTRGQRGGDFSAVLRDISRLVYESVDEQHAQALAPRQTPRTQTRW